MTVEQPNPEDLEGAIMQRAKRQKQNKITKSMQVK